MTILANHIVQTPRNAGPYVGQRVQALVRGKPVAMQVVNMPFVPNRYHRGPAA